MVTILLVLRCTLSCVPLNNRRDELYNNRRKLQDALKFLKSKGFSEEEIFNEHRSDGFAASAPCRDDFGLPILGEVGCNPYKEKMKGKLDSSDGPPLVHKVFEDLPGCGNQLPPPAGEGSGPGVNPPPSGDKSWVNVLKFENVESTSVKFGYFPPEKTGVVEPPVEVLKMGNDKYINCVVGTFTKGVKSYKEVMEFATAMWGKKGLLKVFQKDSRTFVLKFACDSSRDLVLSRGTWYVGRRPMVVTRWGVKPGLDCVDSIPLWIKLANVPDSYWTEEGLSRLASVVGKPLGADALTSKLDLCQFAKIQVLYKLGEPLPDEVSAIVLDPFTEVKSVVQVSISYPFRPLFCSGCKSLGHSIGACPNVTRVWVKKDAQGSSSSISTGAQETPVVNENVVGGPALGTVEKPLGDVPVTDVGVQENWVEVKRKSRGGTPLDTSPSPPRTFKNLKIVDEIEKKKGVATASNTPVRLTKSQKKRLRQHKGSKSPPPST